MRSKVIAATVAGGLLVAAGFVSAVVSAPSSAVAQEGETTDQRVDRVFKGQRILDEVLDELVADGVLDQDQADAVTDALGAKAEEIRSERQAKRELLRELFEDGVLTEAEAAQLGDDHFLLSERFEEAWEDGELSREEVARAHAYRRGFRNGFHRGFHLSPDAGDAA